MVTEEEDSLNEKIKEANISLVINDYNDIFSSFDARTFTEKALSVDFLDECKRAAREKGNSVELRILVPKSIRNQREEWKIKKRLHDHFEHHFKLQEKEISSIKKEGYFWTILGLVVLGGIIFGSIKFESAAWESILTLLEIPGWFLIWEGMDKVLITAREKTPEYEFYKKMSESEINFTDY